LSAFTAVIVHVDAFLEFGRIPNWSEAFCKLEAAIWILIVAIYYLGLDITDFLEILEPIFNRFDLFGFPKVSLSHLFG
jgi:hypothetical protein